MLARVEQDGEAALRALADELRPEVALPDSGPRPQVMTERPRPKAWRKRSPP